VGDDVGKIVQFPVGAAQLLVGALEFVGLAAERVGQADPLGHVLRGAARADEDSLGVEHRRRPHPDVDDGAVLLDPLRLQFAGALEDLRMLVKARPAFGRQDAVVRLVVQVVAMVTEGLEERFVQGGEAAPCIETEVEDRGVVVQVAVAFLESLQVAIDALETVVGLRQLFGPVDQLPFGANALAHVEEVAAIVERLAVGGVARQNVHLHPAVGAGALETKLDIVPFAGTQGAVEGGANLAAVLRGDHVEKEVPRKFVVFAAEKLHERRRGDQPGQGRIEPANHFPVARLALDLAPMHQ
jgi:hypothetical protein